MKSENILRAARNSLLCFFMALGAGFLVACGGSSDPVAPPPAPATPSELSVVSVSEQSESAILVTWSAVSGATSYKLYRSTSRDGEYSLVAGNIFALRYRDNGLNPNTEYFYQLEACNSGGCSRRSTEVSVATRVSPPVLIVSAQSDSEIEATWDPVDGATSYNLYRATNKGGRYSPVESDISVFFHLDNRGLSAGVTYYYQLEACNSGGCSRRSDEESVATQVSPPVLSVQSESEIEATWDAAPDATSYKLYRSTSRDGAYSLVVDEIFALRRHLDTGLSPNTEYYYQLEACDDGVCSRRSTTEASATTRISPPVLSVSEDKITVTWINDEVLGATVYNLYRSTVSGGTYTLIATVGAATLTYTDSELSAETEYFYQLEACDSDGCLERSPEVSATTHRLREFAVYLSDSAAEGVEYSGPIGDGLTWKGGVFSAVKGVFEFSIADTTLGSVSLNIDWANSHVTPADFIGVDEQKVIDIARIVQGLDEDGLPRQNGISVSERARTDVRGDLFDRVANVKDNGIDIFVASSADRSGTFLAAKEYRIPNEETATSHFVDTRKCLFSGVYDGNYRATVGPTDEGQIYYAIQPFADPAWATGVKFSNVNPSVGYNRAIATDLSGPVDIGVIGSTITLSEGNELSFVTPRLVTGIWQEVNEGITDITISGTSRITLAEGNPGATRRIVGVDRGGRPAPSRILGLYVLDYFANDGVDFSNDGDGSFSGRYYDIGANVNFALSLTIVGDGSWSARTTDLILSGTRTAYNGDITATAITVGSITRDGDTHDNDYGSFNATVRTGQGNGIISGTWCDISGAVGVANPPEPLPQSSAAPIATSTGRTQIDIAWYYPIEGARTYNLYRRKTTEPRYTQVLVDGGIETRGYRDSNLEAGTKYSYQLEVCNTSGCSARSPEASATTFSPFP